jgi:acyl dehydratase
MTTTAHGLDELKTLAGADLGHTGWLEITQDRVNAFADATGDHQWIHVDPERARDTPFGGTIAHGYYTLSLAPKFSEEIMKFEGFAFGINYGLNKVRFTAPVPVGSKIRGVVDLAEVIDAKGGAVQVTSRVTVEIEGSERPALVAEWLTRQYV